MKKLSLGFSPCPNDTFIFDAIVNRRIDTGDIEFEPVIEDVETLNRMAMEGVLDLTKLSFHAFFHVEENYLLLNAGAAMGFGCGPLLITRKTFGSGLPPDPSVLVPGPYTTAALLLSYARPDIKNVQSRVFSDIEQEVLEGRFDAGVIIHENRFTYEGKGLVKVADLGEYWESKTGLPVPLGGIFLKKNQACCLFADVAALIRKSLEFALANPGLSAPWIKSHAQESADDVIRSHIRTYVNDYTLETGPSGIAAVDKLREVFRGLR